VHVGILAGDGKEDKKLRARAGEPGNHVPSYWSNHFLKKGVDDRHSEEGPKGGKGKMGVKYRGPHGNCRCLSDDVEEEKDLCIWIISRSALGMSKQSGGTEKRVGENSPGKKNNQW